MRGFVYLAVPKKGVHLVKWRNAVRAWLLEKHAGPYVFHSRHVKVWDLAADLPLSRMLKVEDRTLHFDSTLLRIAASVSIRANAMGYPHETAAAILTHYLFNMAGKGYKDEAAFHGKRAKSQPKTTARRDHGWELDELKKARLI